MGANAIAAVVYCAAFWLIEPLRCSITQGGCQTSGDARALLVVIPISVLVVALALVPYVLLLRQFIDRKKISTINSLNVGSLFLLSFGYGLLIPLVFFTAVGEFGSLIHRDGFWLNTSAASVCFAIYALVICKKLQRVQDPAQG